METKSNQVEVVDDAGKKSDNCHLIEKWVYQAVLFIWDVNLKVSIKSQGLI